MPRSSVKCQFIRDATARKVALKKGKASLVKQMSEIKTLFGVDACLVVYENEDSPPKFWPSESEARRVIEKFQKTVLGTNTIQDHDVRLKKKTGILMRQDMSEEEKRSRDKMAKLILHEKAFNEANVEELEKLARALLELKCAFENELKQRESLKIKEACEKLKEKMV